MSRNRDMTAANWARTLRRLRRQAEELRRYDFQVIEPANVERAPSLRHGRTSAIVDVTRPGVDEGTNRDSAPGRPCETGDQNV